MRLRIFLVKNAKKISKYKKRVYIRIVIQTGNNKNVWL